VWLTLARELEERGAEPRRVEAMRWPTAASTAQGGEASTREECARAPVAPLNRRYQGAHSRPRPRCGGPFAAHRGARSKPVVAQGDGTSAPFPFEHFPFSSQGGKDDSNTGLRVKRARGCVVWQKRELLGPRGPAQGFCPRPRIC